VRGPGTAARPPGTTAKRFGLAGDLAWYLAFVGVVALIVGKGIASSGYTWQWYRVPRFFVEFTAAGVVLGPLSRGLLVTFKITLASLVLAFAFGVAAALMRLSGSVAARAAARVYLELVRNTPLIIQIFFMYFVVSPLVGLDSFLTAVLALSLFEGAYLCEIFRAGILSVARGQWEAAQSLGLSAAETYRHVILPQAVRKIVPTVTGQTVSLVKDSALVSTIAVYDLAMQAQAIVAETFLVFEVWLAVAAVYLAVTMSLSAAAHAVEERFRRFGACPPHRESGR